MTARTTENGAVRITHEPETAETAEYFLLEEYPGTARSRSIRLNTEEAEELADFIWQHAGTIPEEVS